jgi:hypothetical protein
MYNLYYLIWADSIQSIRKNQPNKKDWKISIFLIITTMHSFNLWIVLLWLKYFKVLILPPFNIDIFPGNMIDGFLSFAIEFASPFVLLNYLLIFRNNRYEKIVEKYKDLKIKYGLYYCLSMIIGAFLSAVLYGVLTHTI